MFAMNTQTDGYQYQKTLTRKGIKFIKNPSGYIKAENEYKIYEYLEKYFFENNWSFIPQYKLPITNRPIDYKINTYPTTYIEVKNGFITKKDMKQIFDYWADIKNASQENYKETPTQFAFIVLCMGIDEKRKQRLNKLGIKTVLLKDLIL